MEELKYPVGKQPSTKQATRANMLKWIEEIETFPTELEAMVKNLSINELNWQYRLRGWAIKQVVHHCADSHMNSLVRFKLTLTEDTPTIRPYFENKWAELPDGVDDDISGSVFLLKGLHEKWGTLLRSLSEDQLKLEFFHPESKQKLSIIENIGIYAWHCRHHLAHVKNAIAAKGKYNSEPD